MAAPLGNPRAPFASEHIVQLFDGDASRTDVVAAFFAEGARAGDTLLAVVRLANWRAIASRLELAAVDVAALQRQGRLAVLDAEAALDGFMRDGQPAPTLFAETVGALVNDLARTPLRIYGEMVDLLAAEGNYSGAERLEGFWNELGARVPFTLLCGYCSSHFGPEAAAPALQRICRAHTRVNAHRGDELGSWLVSRNAPRV